MKVYLAAPYMARPRIEPLAHQLERVGITVTARWLNGSHGMHGETHTTDELTRFAREDLDDLISADVLVQFTARWLYPTASDTVALHHGGRHVELGVALANDILTIVVGNPENVFQHLATLRVDTWDEALIELISHRDARRPEPIMRAG